MLCITNDIQEGELHMHWVEIITYFVYFYVFGAALTACYLGWLTYSGGRYTSRSEMYLDILFFVLFVAFWPVYWVLRFFDI